jgi:hypothetical protein
MSDTKVPKRYRAKFIEPGIISYEDVNAGKVFVSREALDRMRNSFIGMPVINWEHKDITPEEAFNMSDEEMKSVADGIISAVGVTDDGWDYADMLIWDLETQENIDSNGFSISCAYIPTEVGAAGTYHGIDYNEEVVNGQYTHMAVVQNPRYERATIFENAKQGEKTMAKRIFKFFKNDAPPKEEPPKEEKVNMDDSVVEIDGQQVPVSELIKVWQGEQAEKGATQNVLNAEDEVDIDGKKVKASELAACYKAAQTKQNADLTLKPADTPTEDIIDADKNLKQNSKVEKNENFRKLENASQQAEQFKPNINTKSERLERGKERYGSIVEVKK